MDKRKSILNVTVSITFKLLSLMMTIVVKRFLIQYCGNEVNGVNALYISIIGFLAVAELGIGTAITFCMYKPIVEGDTDKVSALYHLFRNMYTVVGLVVLVCGLGITPFIRYFARDYADVNINFYSTFILMLISVVLTYFFGAKTALINAHKNNYITSAIYSGGVFVQNLLQIIVVLFTGSFVWYLACRSVGALMQWLATEIVARKKYSHILIKQQRVDQNTKNEVVKNIKAMFAHKIGTLLGNTVDSIVISGFVGIVALGTYSNYITIQGAMVGVINLLFSSLTSVFGHLYKQTNSRTTRHYFELFHWLNFMLAVIFFLGYYAVIDSLIEIVYYENLVIVKSISFTITLNGFIQYMRSCALTFRDATGTFYNDRWKPLVEGTVNIILSITFVKLIGVAGVIVATITTNLLICHVVEPYVLYRRAFAASPKRYYLQNYGMIAVFVATMSIMHFCMVDLGSKWLNLLANGFISVGFSGLICCVTIWVSPIKQVITRRKNRKI